MGSEPCTGGLSWLHRKRVSSLRLCAQHCLLIAPRTQRRSLQSGIWGPFHLEGTLEMILVSASLTSVCRFLTTAWLQKKPDSKSEHIEQMQLGWLG